MEWKWIERGRLEREIRAEWGSKGGHMKGYCSWSALLSANQEDRRQYAFACAVETLGGPGGHAWFEALLTGDVVIP